MVTAIYDNHPQCRLLQGSLSNFRGLETRTSHLTEIAYRWCAVLCENDELVSRDKLLFLSLEIGFRHLNPSNRQIEAKLTHMPHHEQMANIVFGSSDGDVIADLLLAWTSRSSHHMQYQPINMYTERLIGLYNLRSFSSRLRRVVIRSVELIGHRGFLRVGVEQFVGLLNNLCVGIEDMDDKVRWAEYLLDTVQSCAEPQHLSHGYWEFLAEFAPSMQYEPQLGTHYSDVMNSLEEAEEWGKLECWLGVIWVVWPPEVQSVLTEEDLTRVTLALVCRRPNALRKLEQWAERWSAENGQGMRESFQRFHQNAQYVSWFYDHWVC